MVHYRTAAALAVAVFFFLLNALAGQSENGRTSNGIQLQWKPSPEDTSKMVVEVTGIPQDFLQSVDPSHWTPAQWQALFANRTESGDLVGDIDLPPLAGSYQVARGSIRFTPAFPLVPGVWYRATFRPSALPNANSKKAAPVSARYRIEPRVTSPTTIVSAIYPSASVVPENLLKFYLQFSAPMSRGHIYDYIQLRDEKGKPVELPFLEIDEELWNAEMTRLTLFLDPGRIKRGVKPLEEVGPSLESGKRYTLVISKEWRDATGTPLRETHSKSFTVVAPDREAPDPTKWTVLSPKAGSTEAVEVKFPEPLDRALLEHVLQVLDASARRIEGKVIVAPGEQAWRFEPAKPWTPSEYRIQVPTNIEDLAGNNIGKPFDVDLFDRVERKATQSTIALPFRVK